MSSASFSRSSLSSHIQSGRQTINSLTSYPPAYSDLIPAPCAELRIPDPPSRSPSPPTEVIPHNRGGGNKFTPHDRAYFTKFIQWRLKGDPTLVRHELCELLAEKAPHHNPTSWSSYWSSHHELPDKILASIRTQELQVLRRPIRYDPSPGSELTEESEDEEDGEDDIPIPPVERSVDLEEGGSNSLTSKKRKLDDTDLKRPDTDADDDEKAKKRKVASVPNEGKANRNTVAEIATRVRSTTKGAEVWAKAEQLLGTEKEYLFQNPEAFEVWVRRHQLQWRFLMSREYVCIIVRPACIGFDSAWAK
ncbi:hypothetical protein B0H11DRAFT_2029414 [Mycena galericulata]|nr:hypothetical protein B0H11DRAFT_2047194 [Mycena galericulata]KAJ7477846.1 hypothetical protein B0H11DRAFT_2029414 [Mycena galericulata]